MPHRSWTLLESNEVSDQRIFHLRRDLYRFEPSGEERDFVVVDSPSWVNVVPITPEGNVVLIRQFRHGVREVTIEIPGGMIDEGESPEQAAVRELREETGYAGDKIQLLARVRPNPAIQNNWCYLYAAEHCRKVGELHLDPFERIDVFERPLTDIPEMIERGEISHCMIINAFAFLGQVRSMLK
jgi:8-oxo-dGTP pyrophosphatase MutT (NUDIX family)